MQGAVNAVEEAIQHNPIQVLKVVSPHLRVFLSLVGEGRGVKEKEGRRKRRGGEEGRRGGGEEGRKGGGEEGRGRRGGGGQEEGWGEECRFEQHTEMVVNI